MNGTRFWPEIINTLNPGEDPNDILTMIDILGTARNAAVGPNEREDGYEFAAAIICVLLRPFKPPGYMQALRALRGRFRGVANSGSLQSAFSNSFTPVLLYAPNARAAITAGARSLFT
jgi:hypothetical protein